MAENTSYTKDEDQDDCEVSEGNDVGSIDNGEKEYPKLPEEPRVKRRKYQCYKYTNEQLQLALQKCREGMSIRECAKRFGIPKSSLWDKLSGKRPSEMARKGRAVVTRDVENRLVNWILKTSEEGFNVNETQVREAIKLFLDKNNSIEKKLKDNRPGKAWYKSFLKRNPIVTHNLHDNVNADREDCADEKLQNWFEESLDTEVPTFVSTETYQPPGLSSIHQMKSVLEYIELTVGESRAQYFKLCKENKYQIQNDAMYTAWVTLSNKIDSSLCYMADAKNVTPTNKNRRKRMSKYIQQPTNLSPELTFSTDKSLEEEKEEEAYRTEYPEPDINKPVLNLLQLEIKDLETQTKPKAEQEQSIICPNPLRGTNET